MGRAVERVDRVLRGQNPAFAWRLPGNGSRLQAAGEAAAVISAGSRVAL